MNMRLKTLIACGAVWSVSMLPAVFAAEPSLELSTLSAEVQALKARQLAIQADLREIRELLAGSRQQPARSDTDEPAPESEPTAPPGPANGADSAAVLEQLEEMRKKLAVYEKRDEAARQARLPVRDIDFTLDVSDDPFKGPADARLTLVEFTDYQCPYCARHKKTVMPEILKNYVDTGKIRYVLRDFPLAFHANAAKAHEAAHCASEQDKYWEMHEVLFTNQKALQLENLPKYAETAGVADMAAFESCLDSGRYADRGKQSLKEGSEAGVSGTPSFLLGVAATDGSGTVKATKFIRGAQNYNVFEDAIKKLLAPDQG